MNQKERMQELVLLLNQAAKAYYQEGNEIMSNFEYDKLYDELVDLEQETGILLAGTPTQKVGYEVLSELPKEQHKQPMLSLDKTKEVEGLKAFIGDKEGLLSWKLDGLTVVLTYENGTLAKAVTRGNGEVGEVVTNNAKVFKNLPLTIPFKNTLVLRGEAVIRYSDFQKMNDEILDVEAKYKNPRNLCSGSVRQLNNEITAERNVYFYAFALIEAENETFDNSVVKQSEWLRTQGFDVVEYQTVTGDTMEAGVEYFANAIKTYDVPSDGLVLVFDDIAYGISLGRTAKFPRNGIAFKWADEIATTQLLEIEWSASRTGLINPVAIFEPVELEGTTVSRASIHNVSVAEGLELGIGDEIEVYKANMIIPQIADNHTRSGLKQVPEHCPVCSERTTIREDNGFKFLYCLNPDCPAKKIKGFSHFVSRNAMNMEGLSEETLEKFIKAGYLQEYADLYKLDRYKNEIVNTKGFGKKSYDNFIAAIAETRTVACYRLIYGLGILNVGLTNAKVICKHFKNDIENIIKATEEELTEIEGIGPIIANSIVEFFSDEKNRMVLKNLLQEVQIEQTTVQTETNEQIAGKVFVITGSLHTFENRDACKKLIEDLGGKVTGSVSAKTNYLINNDVLSSSSKNKKAKELGIPILTEEEFRALLN